MATDSGSADPEVKEGTINPDENIWKQLLKNAEKGTTSSSAPYESSLMIVGEAGNGKSSILAKWKDRITVETTIPEYILDYSYINVANKYDTDKDAVLSRMNVWQLDDSEHAGILTGLVGDMSKSAFVITLDFSKPATIIDNLEKWLDIFKKTCESCLSKVSAEDQKNLKKKISKYVQFFVDIKKADEEKTEEEPKKEEAKTEGDAAPKEAGEGEAKIDVPVERSSLVMEVDTDIPNENYGIPLFVVGLKADYFEKVIANTDDAEDKFEFVSTRLRKICLDWGATLMYTSAVGDGTNVTELHDQIFHRVFNFPLMHKTKAVGNCSDYGIHVPAGFDSLGIIDAAGSTTGRWNDETPLSEVFVNKEEKKKKAKAEVRVEAKTDQEFFMSLKKQLDSGRPDTGSRSPTKGDNKKKKEKAVKNFFKGLLSGENKPNTQRTQKKKRQGNRKS